MSKNDNLDNQNDETDTPETPDNADRQTSGQNDNNPAPSETLGAVGNLKKLDPKILIGGGVVAVVMLWFMISGGSETPAQRAMASIQKGNSYAVASPNGDMVRLAKAPGFSGGLSDVAEAEGKDDSIICMVEGQARGVIENQSVGQLGLSYVRVKMTEGNCKDKSGWTSSVNLQP